jgi:hypothetical protein
MPSYARNGAREMNELMVCIRLARRRPVALCPSSYIQVNKGSVWYALGPFKLRKYFSDWLLSPHLHESAKDVHIPFHFAAAQS